MPRGCRYRFIIYCGPIFSTATVVTRTDLLQVANSALQGPDYQSQTLRALQQSSATPPVAIKAPDITFVDSPQALVEAVQAGALDIVVTEHLDLTTLPLLPTSICPVGCDSPLGEIGQTRSIRVSPFFQRPRLQQQMYTILSLLWMLLSPKVSRILIM